MDMLSNRNVDEVVSFLKKEIVRTLDQEYEKVNEYRQILVRAVHSCAVRYVEVAEDVVKVLMDFLGDAAATAAVDVLVLIREVVEKYPQRRAKIIESLLLNFSTIKTSRAFRTALWIVGEYCEDSECWCFLLFFVEFIC